LRLLIDVGASAAFIQHTLKMGLILGTAWGIVNGRLLLRVDGHLKPSAEKVYGRAFARQ